MAAVIIVVVNVLHSQGGGEPGGGSAVVSAAAPSPTPTLTAGTSPPAGASGGPTATGHRVAAPTAAVVTAPPPAATAVYVVSVSRSFGRAATAAARLRAAGYNVRATVSRRYLTPSSVVYWDPGNAIEQAAAAGLVARHLGIGASRPRPADVPAFGGLIVLVTAYYQ